MKKIILGLALVAGFAACRSNKSESEKTNVVLLQDTFRMYNNNMLTDKAPGSKNYAAPLGAAMGTPGTAPSAKNRTGSNNNSSNNNVNKTTSTGTTVQAPVPARKKGWSNRAKGAVIGAGTGAAAGAIINGRNRAVGAVIGGIIGAAGGYVLGNEKDRKEGRP